MPAQSDLTTRLETLTFLETLDRYGEVMFNIEFHARIDNGAIEVPEKFRDRLKGLVRVIVVSEAESSSGGMIDELLARPLQIPDFRPLTRNEIYARD